MPAKRAYVAQTGEEEGIPPPPVPSLPDFVLWGGAQGNGRNGRASTVRARETPTPSITARGAMHPGG